MVETFMINQLMIQLDHMMKLERSQLEKEIMTLKTRSNAFTILEKSKETILELYKGTVKAM